MSAAWTHTIDDRHAQFLIVVADACVGAEVAELMVEVLTVDGVRHSGVPTAVEVDPPEITAGCTVRLNGSVVALEEVVEFLVRPPAEAPGIHRS